MADFVLLGALSDPGAPDSDLGHFQVIAGWLAGRLAGYIVKHWNCDTCIRMETSARCRWIHEREHSLSTQVRNENVNISLDV